MSIANELSRLLQAKADLKTAIEAKGVTVPASTTLDGYAALVDQIQQGGSSLPYDAEIEYLESTGTQYIDTGIIASGEFDILLGVKFSSPLSSSTVVCAGIRSSSQFLTLAQKNSVTSPSTFPLTLGYADNYWTAGFNITANTQYDIDFHYVKDSQYAIINGTKYGSKTYSGTLSSNLTIYLFKRNHYGTETVAAFKGQVFYMVIIKNGAMVRDYIPVRKSGVGYMYDRVSGTLFGNAGTGSFTLGPDVT